MGRDAQPSSGLGELIGRLERVERGLAREASRLRTPVAPVVADGGKTTASDADFEVPPIDGTVAVVLNTTDGAIRLALRAGGVWKTSAALT